MVNEVFKETFKFCQGHYLKESVLTEELVMVCEYHFEGDNFSCNWLKEKLVKDQFDVQC